MITLLYEKEFISNDSLIIIYKIQYLNQNLID